MSLLRFIARLLACLAWVLLGLLTIILCYPWAGSVFRGWSKRWWSASLLVLCGVRTSVVGEPRLSGSVLWVVSGWLVARPAVVAKTILNYVRRVRLRALAGE